MNYPELRPLHEYVKNNSRYVIAEVVRYQQEPSEIYVYAYHLYMVPMDNSHRIVNVWATMADVANPEAFMVKLYHEVDKMVLEQI